MYRNLATDRKEILHEAGDKDLAEMRKPQITDYVKQASGVS